MQYGDNDFWKSGGLFNYDDDPNRGKSAESAMKETARFYRSAFESFVAVGFTPDQALRLTSDMITAIITQGLNRR